MCVRVTVRERDVYENPLSISSFKQRSSQYNYKDETALFFFFSLFFGICVGYGWIGFVLSIPMRNNLSEKRITKEFSFSPTSKQRTRIVSKVEGQ